MGAEPVGRVDDVSVSECWAKLQSEAGAVLIDVRTQAEWAFVGVPDLSSIGKNVLPIEWQTFPDNQINPNFGDRLQTGLQRLGANEDTLLYFICRSGGRSRMAAQVAAASGFRNAYNVADGFEGPLDGGGHRGTVGGWKAAGLPWRQG